MARGFGYHFVRPVAVFVGALVAVGAIVLAIGYLLLGLHPDNIVHGDLASEWLRADLLAATLIAVVVLFGCAVLARTPAQPDALDAHRVIGKEDFDAPTPVAAPPPTRRGMPGTVADIREGFTLYAQNGALATVLGVLPGEEEFGRKRRGILYASGLYGANEEMWIPVEAVMSVWPETGSVFLAAKGDEMEHFGWNRPPASFRRTEAGHRVPKSF
jgi:hypothetical protein